MTSVNVVTIAVGFRMLVSIVSLMDIDISRSIASISMVSLDSLRAPVIVAVASITIARFSLSLIVTSIASIAMVTLDSLRAPVIVAVASISIAWISNCKGEERKSHQNNCHG